VLGVGGDGVEPLGQREGEDQTRKRERWRRGGGVEKHKGPRACLLRADREL
jgi:hypothetical protein